MRILLWWAELSLGYNAGGGEITRIVDFLSLFAAITKKNVEKC
jgi:hypothetical protein